MPSLKLASPAKVNLYLRVTGELPDGYHSIVTVFHRISLLDTIEIKKTSADFKLTCDRKDLSTGSDNLITQAYRLLKARFPQKVKGVRVHLTKKIPMGGGLGGGSGNAATFIRGMNQLFKLHMSLPQMIEIGKKLGADVPFFIYDVNQAIGSGKGDILVRSPAMVKKWFVLAQFDNGLSTQKVYENLPKSSKGHSLTKARGIARIAIQFLNKDDSVQNAFWLQNDLESTAIKLKPSIQKVIATIFQLGYPAVAMTGSGPTVFAVLKSRVEAETLSRKLRSLVSNRHIIICHTY